MNGNLQDSSPVVSVVIPSYNYGHFIHEAIGSIETQTLTTWECIVVDDGSTDSTRDIVLSLAQADSRVKYIHQENRGLSAARNTGLHACSGKYIQLLDADDLIQRRKLEHQASYLDGHPNVDLIYSSMRYFRDDNPTELRHTMSGVNKPWMPEVSGSGADVLPILLRKNFMAAHCPLLRRSVIDKVGVFDEALSSCEDWDYWIRCALQGQFFQFQDFEESLALVRFHRTSMSKNFRRMLEATLTMRRKIEPMLSDPELSKFNNEDIRFREQWLQRVDEAMADISSIVPASNRLIIVDDDQVGSFFRDQFATIPFLEKDGAYAGPPMDDSAAISELERLRRSAFEFIVFAWPAFWWLEHYREFADYLRKKFRCVLQTERVIIFDLQEA